MNIKSLKKSIMREALIFSAIVGTIGVGLYFVMSAHDEYLHKKTGLESDTNNLISQKTSLQNKYDNLQKNMNLYGKMEAHAASPGLFIDRAAVKSLFNIYRSQYYLTKIGANMDPVKEFTADPKLIRKNFVTIASEVKVPFEATTDEDMYELIRAFQKELPGFSKVKAITMKKSVDLSETAIQAIKKEGAFKLIEGEIKFMWYGLKATDPNSTDNRVIIKTLQLRRR